MKDISNLHSELIDRVLEGHEKTKIAKDLGIARSYLYVLLDKPEVKAELERRRTLLKKSASDKITNQVGSLVDKMLDLAVNSPDSRVKYNAIKYLLDRSLGVPTAAKEDNLSIEDKSTDNNNLKKELDDIKKLTVVK